MATLKFVAFGLALLTEESPNQKLESADRGRGCLVSLLLVSTGVSSGDLPGKSLNLESLSL